MKPNLVSKILGTNSGAALIQVMMVGTAIVTGSFYMSMQNDVTLKAVGGEYYKMELYVFEQRMKEILVDNQACREIFNIDAGTTDLVGITPVPYNTLQHSSYGLLASNQAGDQGNFNVGVNGMFIIPPGNSIRLSRANPLATPGITEFSVLQVDFAIAPNFEDNIIGPRTITKSIPLFVSMNGNTVRDCYYDPQDPDRTDGLAGGLVSQAIQSVCEDPNASAGTVRPVYNNTTGECFSPGLPLVATSPTTFTDGGFPTALAPGNVLTNIRKENVADTEVWINGAMVNIGEQPRLVFDSAPSPVYLPNIPCDTPGEMITGMNRIADAGSPFGFRYEFTCSSTLTGPEVISLIDQTHTESDCVDGFQVVANPAGTKLIISCSNNTVTPGVDTGGGGVAPLRP